MLAFQPIQDYFLQHPRRLLLLDALGALVTALLNLFVLAQFSDFWGIPKALPEVLAAVALGYFGFSACCAAFLKRRMGQALQIIASLNAAYCLTCLVAAILLHEQLNGLTWVYLLGESAIVMVLAGLEWRTAKALA